MLRIFLLAVLFMSAFDPAFAQSNEREKAKQLLAAAIECPIAPYLDAACLRDNECGKLIRHSILSQKYIGTTQALDFQYDLKTAKRYSHGVIDGPQGDL